MEKSPNNAAFWPSLLRGGSRRDVGHGSLPAPTSWHASCCVAMWQAGHASGARSVSFGQQLTDRVVGRRLQADRRATDSLNPKAAAHMNSKPVRYSTGELLATTSSIGASFAIWTHGFQPGLHPVLLTQMLVASVASVLFALVATRGYLYYSEVEPQLHESGSIWCTLTLTVLARLGLTAQGDLPGLFFGAWVGAMISFKRRFGMTHLAALIEGLVYIISLGFGFFLVLPFFEILMARPR